jgi:hypothetical protein
VSVGGADAADFAAASACPSTLAPGASCNVFVTFSPSAAGARSASLAISDDASGTPHTVALTGDGLAPDAAVATVSTTSLSFPAVPAGTAAPTQDVTLTNTGTLPLSLAHIGVDGAAAGDFSESTTCGTSVAVGASCTITVGFTPAATGARAATLTIDSDAVDGSVTVSLAGTGTLPAGMFLSDGFEGGLGGWHTLGDGTIGTESTTVHGGTTAASLTNAGPGGYSGLYTDFTATTAQTHTRVCFSLSGVSTPTVLAQGRDANGLNLWEVDYDPGLGGLDLYFWNGARARTDLYTSLHAVALDRWYCLDIGYDAATVGAISATLDGQAIGSAAGNFALASPYSRLFLWNNGAAGTVDLDDVTVSSS